eukprot:12430864-Karenia_brevis.AAC.1
MPNGLGDSASQQAMSLEVDASANVKALEDHASMHSMSLSELESLRHKSQIDKRTANAQGGMGGT